MRNILIILSIIMLSCSEDSTVNEPDCGWTQRGTAEPIFNSSEDIGEQCNCSGDAWDECGECGGEGIAYGKCDCDDNIFDDCGLCAGDNSSCSDCAGTLYGDAWVSDCGCVSANNSGDDCDDCLGVPNGSNLEDNCGVCDSDNSNDCPLDCNQTWGGTAVIDECGSCCDGNTGVECSTDANTGQMDCTGTCFGNGCYLQDCLNYNSVDYDCETGHCYYGEDCAGVCFGDAVEDNCGTCDSDSANDCVQDCAGIWGGDTIIDECGVCNGSNECNDNDCDQTVGCGYWLNNGYSCTELTGWGWDCDDCCNSSSYCNDEFACNTGAEGDCEYAQKNYDCDGNCVVDTDCAGNCGGSAVVDNCGVCGGDGYPCDEELVFYEDFDDGIWEDVWELTSEEYEVEFPPGANGTLYSIRLNGDPGLSVGLFTEFETSQPDYISFYTLPTSNSNTTRDASNYVRIANSWGNDLLFFYHKEESNSLAFIGNNSGEYIFYLEELDEWYFIELKNINYNSNTYDVYIDENFLYTHTSNYVSNVRSILLSNNITSVDDEGTWDQICLGTEEQCKNDR